MLTVVEHCQAELKDFCDGNSLKLWLYSISSLRQMALSLGTNDVKVDVIYGFRYV